MFHFKKLEEFHRDSKSYKLNSHVLHLKLLMCSCNLEVIIKPPRVEI
jgi:hypothetical protein